MVLLFVQVVAAVNKKLVDMESHTASAAASNHSTEIPLIERTAMTDYKAANGHHAQE